MSKGQSRVSYTRRIMELVGNISKQKEGIAMILADTQQVQREINQLSGKLERIFIVTDEQIFKVRVVPLRTWCLSGLHQEYIRDKSVQPRIRTVTHILQK